MFQIRSRGYGERGRRTSHPFPPLRASFQYTGYEQESSSLPVLTLDPGVRRAREAHEPPVPALGIRIQDPGVRRAREAR